MHQQQHEQERHEQRPDLSCARKPPNQEPTISITISGSRRYSQSRYNNSPCERPSFRFLDADAEDALLCSNSLVGDDESERYQALVGYDKFGG